MTSIAQGRLREGLVQGSGLVALGLWLAALTMALWPVQPILQGGDVQGDCGGVAWSGSGTSPGFEDRGCAIALSDQAAQVHFLVLVAAGFATMWVGLRRYDAAGDAATHVGVASAK